MFSKYIQRALLAVVVAFTATSASAFSLLGPFAVDNANAVWQEIRNGYQIFGNIGGPLNIGEEYRWNIKTITYGFDESFLNYFGQRGVDEINKAIAILNALPPVSKLSPDLAEFATDTKRVNYRASALGLLDLKSTTLATLIEEMGLAGPEHYAWTLRTVVDNAPIITYRVIRRNFDPVTLAPSPYVNGTLYTYVIIDPVAIVDGTPVADAVELPVDPLAAQFTSVAGAADPMPWAGGFLLSGQFFTGLTRDDVGGLRYIYRPDNYNIETLIPGTTGGGGSPYGIPGATNSAVDTALRPGVDKILFKQAKYDSVLGNFKTNTVRYKDTYIANSRRFKQRTQRTLEQPDILFGAADIDGFLLLRTVSWLSNDLLNGQTFTGGPGIVVPRVDIVFNKLGTVNFNQNPFYLDEFNIFAQSFVWASFDGTTNAPFVYPLGTSIEALEQQVLGGH